MRKIINKIFFISVVFFGLNSCVDNDPEALFDDVPSVRIAQQTRDLKGLLQASADGWKVTYFTDDSELGGFTYLIDFTGDKTVEMDSDFGATKGTRTASEWDVTLGSTVKLVFSTRNKIHELSDSANSPDDNLVGQGYKGSFEFLYYGKEGDDLIFRANRGFNEVIFKKATASDWTDLSTSDDIKNLITGQLAYELDGVRNSFDYNIARRFATNTDTTVNGTDFGLGFTPTGIIVSPAIIAANGNSYSKLSIDDAKSQFISEDGEFSIAFLSPPFNINQDWRINVVGEGEVSTLFFNTFVGIFNANRATYPDETLGTTIVFGNTFDSTPPGIMFRSFTNTETGDGFWAEYNLSFPIFLSDLSLFTIAKEAAGFNWSFYEHLDPLLDLIVNSAPYKVEATPVDNPTAVKLTSVDNPNVFFIIRK